MKFARLPALAALVISLSAGAALAAEVSTDTSGAATGGVNATVGGTSVAADTNANAAGGVNANTNSNALGEIDVAKAGMSEDSRVQFLATLTPDQQADLKARCKAAGITGASTDTTTLDASAKALCELALKQM